MNCKNVWVKSELQRSQGISGLDFSQEGGEKKGLRDGF